MFPDGRAMTALACSRRASMGATSCRFGLMSLVTFVMGAGGETLATKGALFAALHAVMLAGEALDELGQNVEEHVGADSDSLMVNACLLFLQKAAVVDKALATPSPPHIHSNSQDNLDDSKAVSTLARRSWASIPSAPHCAACHEHRLREALSDGRCLWGWQGLER